MANEVTMDSAQWEAARTLADQTMIGAIGVPGDSLDCQQLVAEPRVAVR